MARWSGRCAFMTDTTVQYATAPLQSSSKLPSDGEATASSQNVSCSRNLWRTFFFGIALTSSLSPWCVGGIADALLQLHSEALEHSLDCVELMLLLIHLACVMLHNLGQS